MFRSLRGTLKHTNINTTHTGTHRGSRDVAYRLVGANKDVWPGLLFDETGSVTFRCDMAGPLTILKDDYSMRFRKCQKKKSNNIVVEKNEGVDDEEEEKEEEEEEKVADSKDDDDDDDDDDDEDGTTKNEESVTTSTIEATMVLSDTKNRIELSEKESIYTLSEKDIGRYVTIRIRELKDVEEKIPCSMQWRWEVQEGEDSWIPVVENLSRDLERVFQEGETHMVRSTSHVTRLSQTPRLHSKKKLTHTHTHLLGTIYIWNTKLHS